MGTSVACVLVPILTQGYWPLLSDAEIPAHAGLFILT